MRDSRPPYECRRQSSRAPERSPARKRALRVVGCSAADREVTLLSRPRHPDRRRSCRAGTVRFETARISLAGIAAPRAKPTRAGARTGCIGGSTVLVGEHSPAVDLLLVDPGLPYLGRLHRRLLRDHAWASSERRHRPCSRGSVFRTRGGSSWLSTTLGLPGVRRC
jgi:hypothetical protein